MFSRRLLFVKFKDRDKAIFFASTLGLALIASAYLCLLFLGALSVGPTSDEHIHMLDLGAWRWTSDPTNERHFGVYGLSFQLLGHVGAVIAGIEKIGLVGFSVESFQVRHLVVAVLLICTAVAASAIAALLTKSRILGAWVFVASLSIPPLLGHGFFNTKDIPVACGYTLFTLSAIWSLVRFRRAADSKFFLPIFITSAFGIWLAAGTRLGMIFPFLLTSFIVVFLVIALGVFYRRGIKRVFMGLLGFGSGTLSGFLALGLTNPCIVAPVSPDCRWGLELMPRIFGVSSNYGWTGTIFLAGREVSAQDPSFWVLPVAIAAGTPLFLGIFALFGAIFFLENYRQTSVSSLAKNAIPARVLWACEILLLGMQVALVPVAAIILRSTIYDSQRQFLFVYPAVAVFSGLGLALAYQLASKLRYARFVGRALVSLVAVVALVLPLYESWRLWPYTYVYVNEVSTLGGYSELWETDYWQASSREALSFIPKDAQFMTGGGYWLFTPDIQKEIKEGLIRRPTPEGFYVIRPHRQGFGWASPVEGCLFLSQVQRELRGHVLPMAYISFCPPETGKKGFWSTQLAPYNFIVQGA